MKTEIWKKVRCKFFEDDYKYNSKSQIKGEANIILKPRFKSGESILLRKRVDGFTYTKQFNIEKLINTDFYMDETPVKILKQNPLALKRVNDSNIRSCSLADINTLNLT